MKKLLLLLLCVPFIGFCQIEYVEYESEKIQFTYPNTYTISDEVILYEIEVKLESNTISSIGGYDNIGIHINYLHPSLEELDEEEVTEDMIKDLELDLKRAGIENFNVVKLSSGVKKIYGKEVFAVVYQMEFPDYGITMAQMTYIYIQKNQNYILHLASGSLKELYEREDDLNHILKTLVVK